MINKMSSLLIFHKIDQQEKEEFNHYIIEHNLKRIRLLCIFSICLEALLLMMALLNVFSAYKMVYAIIFSFLAFGVFGYMAITVANGSSKVVFTVVNDVLLALMLLLSIIITRNNLIQNDTNIMVYFITLFAFSSMIISRPIKAITY